MSRQAAHWLQAVATMVMVPLLVAMFTWTALRFLNDFDPQQDWVALYMSLSLGALSWLLVWGRILLSTSSKEIS